MTRIMVKITKKDGEGEPIIITPDSSTEIYGTVSVEAKCHMMAHNQKMQKGENKIVSKVNALKKASLVTKLGRSFAELLTETYNLPRGKNTSEDPRKPIFQVLLNLYTDTIKDDFYHIGGNISELSDQKKQTVAAEIVWKWRWIIVGSDACIL